MSIREIPARGALGDLLLATLLASMGAGRIETALIAIAVATAAAAYLGAEWPTARWFRNLGIAGGIAVALNLYLVRGAVLPLPVLFGQPATLDGLERGVLLALRLLGAGLSVHGLSAAWPGEVAADEIGRRLAPLGGIGLPVADVRAMIGLALRFGPLVAREYARIARIQELRAGRPARGLRERLERRRAAVIPAFVGALETAERVALALEARHYGRRGARARPAVTRAGAPAMEFALRALGVLLVAVSLGWRS